MYVKRIGDTMETYKKAVEFVASWITKVIIQFVIVMGGTI